VSARMICRGLGAALLLTAAGASLLPGAAHADESRSLVAVASASGMRVGYSIPDQFAVSQFIDGGGPVAQASLDSTGKSIGFGSLPYPGENAVAAPGVLTLATKVPVPSYPFYAEASYPVTPSSEVKDPSGAYDLSARAEQHKAEGLAAVEFGGAPSIPGTPRTPGPVARVVSTASGTIDAGATKVTAVSVGEGFRFGDGLLTIASGTSRSVTTYAPGAAKPETKNELVIEGAKVGDQAVTIGPDGVHPAGQSIRYPGGADQVNQALSAAGITVRTLSPQNGEGSATTEALQVTVKHPVPGSKVWGTLVYEFGASSSSITFGADGGGLAPLPGGIETTGPAADSGSPVARSADATAPAGAATTTDPGRPAARPTGGLTRAPLATSPGTGDAARPGGTDTGAAAPASPEAAAPASPEARLEVASEPALARADLKRPGRVLMAVLAAAGAILLAASTLWRKAL
jgi:hypothetical protein